MVTKTLQLIDAAAKSAARMSLCALPSDCRGLLSWCASAARTRQTPRRNNIANAVGHHLGSGPVDDVAIVGHIRCYAMEARGTLLTDFNEQSDPTVEPGELRPKG